MITLRRLTTGTLVSLMVLGLVAPAAGAVNQNVGQALEIAPPVLNLRANPGATINSTINLRDVSTSPLVVRNQINDFTAAGEDGTPKLILDNKGEDSPYSLRKWIQPLPQFTLKPREVNDLPLKIKVPKNAAPGGYFAVVRFTASPPGLDGTGVALSASLGTLVLLRVNGDAKEKVSIEDFSATFNGNKNWLFESAPVVMTTRLKNSGNSLEQPVGQAVVSDMFGNKIGAVNVNLDGRNVLPGSTRKFDGPLDSSVIGNRFLFGRYTADLTVKYGSDGQVLKTSTSFWVIPWRLTLVIIAVLIALIIVSRIALARYNERLISKSRSRRRRR